MDINHLKQILELVREHELAEFEIEHDGLRVRIRKDAAASRVVALPGAPAVAASPVPAKGGPQPAGPAPAASSLPGGAAGAAGGPGGDDAHADAEVDLAVVKSPIVGTFYRSAEPGTPSFVEIGSTVKKGQVLCIIEAMKLMNEIDSEYDGEVANIYVENGQPVQYGERLFAIRTR